MIRWFYGIQKVGRRKNIGVALLLAISVLGLFSMLGMYYVRDSELELRRTQMYIDDIRANIYADAGVQLAMAELQRAWHNDTLVNFSTMNRILEVEIPYYKSFYLGKSGSRIEPSDTYKAKIHIEFFDESGKININCSSAGLLQKVMNVDGETARQIVGRLNQSAPKQKWFYLQEDLINFLPNIQADQVFFENVSTWNAGNPAKPISYLNVNAMSDKVFSAVFNIPLEETTQILSKRPFATVSDLVTAIGRDPATFAIKLDPNISHWQFPLTNKSSSFRVLVKAETSRYIQGRAYNRNYQALEVGIVIIDGEPHLVWKKEVVPDEDKRS